LPWREVLAVIALVALCDLTVYRGHGYSGFALLFAVGPVLLLLGSPQPRFRTSSLVVAVMLWLLAARMVWLGSGLAVAAGLALLAAFAASLAGMRPYVLDVAAYAVQSCGAGFCGLVHYGQSAAALGERLPRVRWWNVLLPAAAVALFGTIFVLANPYVVTWVRDTLDRLWRSAWDWFVEFGPTWPEVLFWAAVGYLAIGLLRPLLRRSVLDLLALPGAEAGGDPPGPAESRWYAACRNTLAALIVLFAAYLAFEYHTLWFRTFPKGFYYAGYAHEGAAWLTAALALATVVLSAVFRGPMLRDPRLAKLRRLAWVWSAENLVLALAVYNRLYIYIGFNGMTYMRTIGLFGVSAVVVGFLLVMWKIAYRRDFVWLLHRHLWTVAIAAYLFALTPVDALVHRYNVRRVLAGDLAPSVQISEHPITAEGILVLHPLVGCRDPIIREGIRAMLAERALRAEQAVARCRVQGWTAYQLSDVRLLGQLRAVRSDWEPYRDPAPRSAALARFHKYAYQWY